MAAAGSRRSWQTRIEKRQCDADAGFRRCGGMVPALVTVADAFFPDGFAPGGEGDVDARPDASARAHAAPGATAHLAQRGGNAARLAGRRIYGGGAFRLCRQGPYVGGGAPSAVKRWRTSVPRRGRRRRHRRRVGRAGAPPAWHIRHLVRCVGAGLPRIRGTWLQCADAAGGATQPTGAPRAPDSERAGARGGGGGGKPASGTPGWRAMASRAAEAASVLQALAFSSSWLRGGGDTAGSGRAGLLLERRALWGDAA